LPHGNFSLPIPITVPFSKHLLKAVPMSEKTSFETHGYPPFFPEAGLTLLEERKVLVKNYH
jgi:hypothetical protein